VVQVANFLYVDNSNVWIEGMHVAPVATGIAPDILWDSPSAGDEIIPARRVFDAHDHGSAADLAAIAGVLVSILGQHVGRSASGAHLVALPHAPEGPAHQSLAT
jgi:hypothetical protein